MDYWSARTKELRERRIAFSAQYLWVRRARGPRAATSDLLSLWKANRQDVLLAVKAAKSRMPKDVLDRHERIKKRVGVMILPWFLIGMLMVYLKPGVGQPAQPGYYAVALLTIALMIMGIFALHKLETNIRAHSPKD